MPTDPILLHRAFSEDDGEAWAEIVREYTPLIRRFAYSIGWHERYMDDLIQEVLVTLLKKRGEFEYDPKGRFRNYLFAIVRFTAFALGRRIAREHLENGDSSLLDSLARDDGSLQEVWDAQYRLHHQRRAFEEASRTANPKHWEVFLDLTLRCMEPKDVAEKHGLSVDNVYQIKKRLTDAIAERVRRQIKDEDLPG